MGSNTAPWDVSHRWTPLHPAQGPQHCALGPPAAKQAEAASKAEPAAHFFFAAVAISMLVASWWDSSCACTPSWTCTLLKSDVPNPKGFSSRKSSAAPKEAVPDG